MLEFFNLADRYDRTQILDFDDLLDRLAVFNQTEIQRGRIDFDIGPLNDER